MVMDFSQGNLKLLVMKSNKINIIPEGTYEGYIWMSDATEPIIVDGKMEALELNPEINPFIIEARLYSPVDSVSYSVKYVDGEYIAICFDVNAVENDTETVCKRTDFIPNRMKAIDYLKFLQVWRPEIDPLCADMEVLMPAEQIFVGFKRKEIKS